VIDGRFGRDVPSLGPRRAYPSEVGMYNFIRIIKTSAHCIRFGIVIGNQLDRRPPSIDKRERREGNQFDDQIRAAGQKEPEDEPLLPRQRSAPADWRRNRRGRRNGVRSHCVSTQEDSESVTLS